jgi:hypothetical protein
MVGRKQSIFMGNHQSVVAKIDATNQKRKASKAFEATVAKGKINIRDRFILQSMLSVGYTPYTALAELVDNAIDGQAKTITIEYDAKSNTLIISDDGIGMSYTLLDDSMDFGVSREYDTTDIGYFGVGMKSSILNLLNLDEESNHVKIISNTGDEATMVTWTPAINVLDYDITAVENTLFMHGTRISINNVKRMTVATLKKNLGVMFYPVLRNEVVKIIVNGTELVGNDPLYRQSNLTKKPQVVTEARVKNHLIPIEVVALHPNEPNRHSWETREGGETTWSFGKSGIYIVYGSRYIEFGGTLGVRVHHPSMNYVRIEFTIPKDLTEVFDIKFNKTQGLDLRPDLEKNEVLSDLIQKIKDAYKWGLANRELTDVAPKQDKNELDALQKLLNQAATKARISKPEKQKSDDFKKPSVIVQPEPDNKTRPKPERNTRIIEKETFILRFANLGNTSVFWDLGYENNKFVITLNDGHVFYSELWSNMNESARGSVVFMIAAMATAQYESIKALEATGKQSDIIWEDFWGVVSMRLRHLVLSK